MLLFYKIKTETKISQVLAKKEPSELSPYSTLCERREPEQLRLHDSKESLFAHLRALKGGTAVTLPTGLGPVAGGIMTSRPGWGLDTGVRTGGFVGETTLAGLKGRGL